MTAMGSDRAGAEDAGGRHEVWLTRRPDATRAPADSLTVALCYPESYALGMSNLGFQTALQSFSQHPHVHCERAFLDAALPGADGFAPPHAGAAGDPGIVAATARTQDTGTPISEFDVVAFSVSYEPDYMGLAKMLHEAGIPLRSSERGDDAPVVVMGGVAALLNPEPVADLLDAVAVGDATALAPALADSLLASRGSPRERRMRLLAQVPGIYVPALYEPVYGADGGITGLDAASGAAVPVRAVWPARRGVAETCVLSDGSHFGDTYLIEVSRGCARRCRYCAAGHVYGPTTFHPAAEISDRVSNVLKETGRVGLVSAALADHPEVRDVLSELGECGAEVTISSLHADRVDESLASLLVAAGVRTVTLAPETGAERLRSVAGKPMTDRDLLAAASALGRAGVESLKLYFMVGLPWERDADVDAIDTLARRMFEEFASGRLGARVSAGVSPFVPKPRTPFQWLPMASERELREKLSRVRRALSAGRRIEVTASGPREARREGVLARGGRELSEAIVLHGVENVPWKAAMRRSGVDPARIIDRERGEDEVFPWDILEVGVPRQRLLTSLRRARDQAVRP